MVEALGPQNQPAERVLAETGDSRGPRSSSDSESLHRLDVISDEDPEPPRVSIKSRLNSALQQDMRNSERLFLPSGDLKRICDHFSVREDLIIQYGYDKDEAESCATYVCAKPARELFSILVLIDYVNLFPALIQAGFFDVDLPFTWNTRRTELMYRESRHRRQAHFLNSREYTEMMREFYDKQWLVHVPFLDCDRMNHNRALNFRYDKRAVIPWTEICVQDPGGGYGVVEKVRIHKDHHSFEHEAFALKTMDATYDEQYSAFQQEIAAFRKMQPGPHLVNLCATLEITEGNNFLTHDKFMLLFPWAEGGSLKMLIDKSKKGLLRDYSLTEKDFVRWVAEQCQGLIEGLETIHDTRIREARVSNGMTLIEPQREFGIHGHIQPTNILHFSQEGGRRHLGNLKIADFGFMTFHTRVSRDRDLAFAAFQTYRAPEHDICYYMSKKIDVWALGCVFSQLITWVILDKGACEDYQQARLKESSYSGVTEGKGEWHEDSFFVKHVQKEKELGKSGRSPVGRRSASGQSRRSGALLRCGQKFKASFSRTTRKLQYLFLVPERFEKVPRLKSSVIEWINNLIRVASHKERPTFLTDFLPFIRDEMLNPEREPRTDCRNALEFLDNTIPQGSDTSWYFDL